MNALQTATAAALLTAATLAIDPAQSQMPHGVSRDVNAALSLHEGRATDTGFIAASATDGAIPRLASCSHKLEAMKDASVPTAFAATVAQDGMTQVALGVLALRRSRNCQVRQFAQKMVQDYGRANQELQSLVERKALILPTRLDAKYEAMVRSLSKKSNAVFDKAYLELVAKDHAQAIAWFESASKSSDSDVAAFALKTLATLQEHKQLLLQAAGMHLEDQTPLVGRLYKKGRKAVPIEELSR